MSKVKRKILLNPGPATTTDSVKKAQIVSDICPREKDFQEIMTWVRKNLVKIAGGDENHTCILFAGSGTAVMEATLTSVVPPDKKALIISNGLYGERFIEIADTYKIPYVPLKFEWGRRIDLNEIENTLKKNKDITCIIVIHHETTTGVLNPIKEISKIAKEHNCIVIADTISSFAGVDFSIKDYNIDFIMSTSNKCIQGMPGISFVICKKSELEKTRDYPPRSFYFNLYRQYEYFEKTGQMRFTPPVQVLYALKQAIIEFFEEGAKNRYYRYKRNYETLTEGLKNIGFKFYLDNQVENSNILLTVIEPDHPNFNFNTLHDKLYIKGFTIYPGLLTHNTFRIAVMGAIDSSDIKNFLEAINRVLEEMKVDLKSSK